MRPYPIVLLWLATMLAAVALVADARAQSADVPGDLSALTKAAQAEGSLTVYFGPTENIARKIANGFSAKYAIPVKYTRIPGPALVQRYATEAAGNTFAADILFVAGGATAFAAQGVKEGWFDPVAEAGLPVLRGGEFPARFNRVNSAVVQIGPWLIAYNTDKVKPEAAPKDWTDLLDEKNRAAIIIPYPRGAAAFLDFWSLILDRLGEGYFDRLRALAPRFQDSSYSGQSLAAGEGAFLLPGTAQQVQAVTEKGAPIRMAIPDLTTGVEMHLMLTSRGKAKSPNAARLMANYVMSLEGNKVMNDEPGNISVYDTSGLPKQYVSPSLDSVNRRDQIFKVLGVQ